MRQPAGICWHCRAPVVAVHEPVDWRVPITAVHHEHKNGQVECELPQQPGRVPYTATPRTP